MIVALVVLGLVLVAVYAAGVLLVAGYLTLLVGPPGWPASWAIRVAALWPIALARRK